MITWILLGVIAILLVIIGRITAASRYLVADIYDLISHLRTTAHYLDKLSIVFMEMSNNLVKDAKPEEMSVISWLRENHRILQIMRESHLETIDTLGEGNYKKFEKRWHKSISQ